MRDSSRIALNDKRIRQNDERNARKNRPIRQGRVWHKHGRHITKMAVGQVSDSHFCDSGTFSGRLTNLIRNRSASRSETGEPLHKEGQPLVVVFGRRFGSDAFGWRSVVCRRNRAFERLDRRRCRDSFSGAELCGHRFFRRRF